MSAGEDEVAERQARTVVAQRLHEAMRALPDHERQVLQRHYFEEQELKAVAKELNIGYATARRHHNSALDALAASVEAA